MASICATLKVIMPRNPGRPKSGPERTYVLKLYVAGATRRSQTAITTVTSVCKEHSKWRIDLEIVDIYQSPSLGGEAGILATPTLVKQLPLPAGRLVGNLDQPKRILDLLDLKAEAACSG